MKNPGRLLKMLLLIGLMLPGAWGRGDLNAQSLPEELQAILSNSDTLINGIEFGGSVLLFGGVSAALITPSGEVFSPVSGQATPAVPMNAEFRLGASDVTQTLLAALTFALEAEGALALGQPISTYINAGSLTNIPGSITVRQLLTHTSGLDEFSDHPNYQSTLLFDVNRVFTPAELTQLFVGAPSSPGSFSYANTNYLVLGLVLDAANGSESLQESLDRLILTPAGISGVVFYETSDPQNFAPLFADVFGSGFPQQLSPNTSVLTGAAFAGNLLATPADLVRFLQALANEAIIDAENLQEMLSFNSINGRLSDRYGAGIEEFTIDVNGREKTVIGHTGDINYVSLALYDPADSVGVALTSNNALTDPQDLLDVAVQFFEAWENLGPPTSIDPAVLENSLFHLFPNPAADNVSIQFELLRPATVSFQIHNLAGQIVLEEPELDLPAGTFSDQLEISRLAPGIYLFLLEVNGQSVARKLIRN